MSKNFKGSLFIISAALVWGLAFVAQKNAAGSIGVFSYIMCRSVVTCAVLIPLCLIRGRGLKRYAPMGPALRRGLVMGVLTFGAISLQQWGMEYTSASKSGFVTALYIVLVPLLGLFFGKKPGLKVWLAVAIALMGAALLSLDFSESLLPGPGEALTFGCALVFSLHILYVDHRAQQLDSTALHVKDLSVGYGERTVLDTLNVDIKRGAVTSIVGPNGCGKSTLLRTMSRLLNPTKGEIVLDGKSIHDIPTRKLATQLGLLPQTPIAPDGIVVADLVGRGRTPHHGILGRWSQQDYDIVAEALETTGISDLAERSIDELSGGQRQRVWIAMALAQRTDTLLLDEPTTYLDVKHQLDVLDLLTELNRDRGTTIVMVLHDLNLAARYSDELVAVSGGKVFAHGHPREVITKENVKSVFGIDSVIITDPVSDQPAVMPIGRHHLRNK